MATKKKATKDGRSAPEGFKWTRDGKLRSTTLYKYREGTEAFVRDYVAKHGLYRGTVPKCFAVLTESYPQLLTDKTGKKIPEASWCQHFVRIARDQAASGPVRPKKTAPFRESLVEINKLTRGVEALAPKAEQEPFGLDSVAERVDAEDIQRMNKAAYEGAACLVIVGELIKRGDYETLGALASLARD